MNKFILSLVVFGVHSVTVAAPMKAKVDTGTVLDILAMPEQNRYQTAVRLPDQELYKELMTIAGEVGRGHTLRWRALTLAAQIKGIGALKDMWAKLNSKEWFVRNAALLGIHHVSAEEGHKAALRLLKDPALVVRSAAVAMLKDDLTRSERDLLWEELNANYNFRGTQSLWVRGEILQKLALRPAQLEAPLFRALLKDKDQRLYPGARQALASLGIKTSK